MLLKRAMKGQPDLLTAAREVARELSSLPVPSSSENNASQTKDQLVSEKHLLANLKKVVLMIAGAAVQRFGQQLETAQELVMNIADMLSLIYLSASALLRADKLLPGLDGAYQDNTPSTRASSPGQAVPNPHTGRASGR